MILQKDISLKSVLLLVIFAAVDIAASTGFIMVRIIMVSWFSYHNRYHPVINDCEIVLTNVLTIHKLQGAMSNSDFPRDMRQLSVGSEHDQLAAFVTLRMSVLQVSHLLLAPLFTRLRIWMIRFVPILTLSSHILIVPKEMR